MEQKFFRCLRCGNIVAMVHESGIPLFCCGAPMTELIPHTEGEGKEKHLPVIAVNGNIVTVTVGSIAHPTGEEHHIAWVSLQTKFGNQRKSIEVGKPAAVTFSLVPGDEAVASYCYCNVHGLWKTTL